MGCGRCRDLGQSLSSASRGAVGLRAAARDVAHADCWGPGVRGSVGMKLDLEPGDATIGAVVRGITLNAIDDATWHALHDAWLEYALLIFPGQNLTRDEQKAIGRRLGKLEYEMLQVGNVKPDGSLYTPETDLGMVNLIKGTQNWH